MPHLMVQSSLHYFTDLPKDVAVNTWHFDAPGVDLEAEATVVANLVSDFFLSPGTGTTNAIGAYIAPIVRRTAGGIRFKVYDMSQPRPRVPILEASDSLQVSLSSTSMPLEVAVCNSFAAEREPGIPPGRRRGRVFIGPLASSAITLGGPITFPHVATGFQDNLRTQSQQLAISSRSAGAPWCVYSRRDNTLSPVWRGWTDNEPDTQRRRQPSPAGRNSWSLSI